MYSSYATRTTQRAVRPYWRPVDIFARLGRRNGAHGRSTNAIHPITSDPDGEWLPSYEITNSHKRNRKQLESVYWCRTSGSGLRIKPSTTLSTSSVPNCLHHICRGLHRTKRYALRSIYLCHDTSYLKYPASGLKTIRPRMSKNYSNRIILKEFQKLLI